MTSQSQLIILMISGRLNGYNFSLFHIINMGNQFNSLMTYIVGEFD